MQTIVQEIISYQLVIYVQLVVLPYHLIVKIIHVRK